MIVEQQSLVIATTDGSLRILELQRAGGQRMTTMEFLNANGEVLPGLSSQSER
jgi:methionyl-tRNA formyltransferase